MRGKKSSETTANFSSFILEHATQSDVVAGVDEVGRGALFGPVVAAAVILPSDAATQLIAAGLRDSKKLTLLGRQRFAQTIRAVAIDYQIGQASVEEIEQFNILQASLLAMKRAVTQLKVEPKLCLVDGKWEIPQLPMPQQTIIKGDERSPAIAAASIIAKVWRDELVLELAKHYPEYDLAGNKGYGTAKHLAAIKQYGPCQMHRRSFSPCSL
jgi:ribonuclease HII